ncbi:cytochrome oxidase assembly [Rhizophagus irregularis DAOM 181602=DAOM 197198]|nr:cytochrome oxidase assembly [Rhizophagus irregularis DAOM 181602=DAOM 197198]
METNYWHNPPLNNARWEEEFEKYKQFPEYKLLNYNMTLPEFKYFISWNGLIEFGDVLSDWHSLSQQHIRFRGYMTKATLNKVIGLAGLLGFQGVLGWYMVKSGLSEESMAIPNAVPRVLRDAKIANGTFPKTVAKALANPAINTFRRSAIGMTALVFLTSMSGALVAGLDAGLIYNEFPYMGQGIVPPKSELFSKTYAKAGDISLWRNFFDNPTTVQFDHRVLAVTTLSIIIALWLYSRKIPLPSKTKLAANYLLGIAVLQVTLGISTLIYMVPIPLASAHQAGSLTLLSTALC